MRFIVNEQPYERRIASGQFRYRLDGAPTGAVETWRRTRALAGYEVLRVDLDAQAAPSGHSYLYNLVWQADGRPERLAYRFWGTAEPLGRLDIAGTLLFAADSVTGTRTVNGRTYAEDLDLAPDTQFWFPAAVGLGLAARRAGDAVTAVTLNNQIGGADSLALMPVTMAVTRQAPATLTIAGQPLPVVPAQIAWNGQTRLVWRDENGWPVMIEREDGLTAVETRYTWHE